MSQPPGWLPDPEPGGAALPWTPSRVNATVKALLQDMDRVRVQGEICDFRGASASGHLYFGLRDERSRLPAVMWRSSAARLAFTLANGQAVVASGRVDLYAEGGRYQFLVDRMEPAGVGNAAAALEALKRKLSAEGLFDADRKRALPRFPRVVGVVTSERAAALQDVLRTVDRRYPLVKVLLSPAPVQGPTAAPGLVRALRRLEDDGRPSVILLVRGGGSVEDLAAFNDEGVVRAVADCTIPVVSGVGHEIDTSLCDFAADQRAATPTAAAEAALPDRRELAAELEARGHRLLELLMRSLDEQSRRVGEQSHRLELQRPRAAADRRHLEQLQRRLLQSLRFDLLSRNQRLALATEALAARHPGARLERGSSALGSLRGRLSAAMAAQHRSLRTQVVGPVHALDALSPLRVLGRGYAIAFDERDRAVRDSAALRPGQRLRLRFSKGQSRVRVEPPEGG
jgi:exodeoxyribonuclease VII large subunit